MFYPTRDEVAAELVVFIREAVRELGEERAVGFLKKFYGWYLGHGRFPKPFKQEVVELKTTDEVVTRLFAAAPGAAPLVEQLETELPDLEQDDFLLEGHADQPVWRRLTGRLLESGRASLSPPPPPPLARVQLPTIRSPSSVRNGSTWPIVRECGAIRATRPPVPMTGASTPSSPRIASTMPSTWPAKP